MGQTRRGFPPLHFILSTLRGEYQNPHFRDQDTEVKESEELVLCHTAYKWYTGDFNQACQTLCPGFSHCLQEAFLRKHFGLEICTWGWFGRSWTAGLERKDLTDTCLW